MDVLSGKMLAMGIAIIAVAGPGIGLGLAVKAMLESVARQPETEKRLSTYFWAGAGLIEACAIYALVVALLIGFVIK